MSPKDLIELLEAEFPTEPRPKKTVLDSFDEECLELRRILGRRSWAAINGDEYEDASWLAGWLTDEAKAYYLPGFVAACVRGLPGSGAANFVGFKASEVEQAKLPWVRRLSEKQRKLLLEIFEDLHRKELVLIDYLDTENTEKFW